LAPAFEQREDLFELTDVPVRVRGGRRYFLVTGASGRRAALSHEKVLDATRNPGVLKCWIELDKKSASPDVSSKTAYGGVAGEAVLKYRLDLSRTIETRDSEPYTAGHRVMFDMDLACAVAA